MIKVIILNKDFFFGLIFLLLYLTVFVRPLVPVMIYYANFEYISTELGENKDKPEMEGNGRSYLRALQKRIAPIKQEKPVTTVPVTVGVPLFTVNFEVFKVKIPIDYKKSTNPNFSKHFVISEYSSSIFRPPQFIV